MLQLALSSCRPMLDLCGDCCVCKALYIEAHAGVMASDFAL